ncbi:MAG: N-acetylmuramoyl-L-alanine amidase, partial [Verrucomicrobiaceae bacterium]
LDQVKEFYHFNKAERSGADIRLQSPTVAFKLTAGSTECTLNGMKVVLESPVLDTDGTFLISRSDLSNLVEPVLRPSRASSAGRFRTIIIDPVSPGLSEGDKDPTLEISNVLAKQLKQQGFQVILTRDSATAPEDDRVATSASVTDGAVFISISLGGAGEKERGIATSAINGSGQGSVPLAASIHGAVIRRLGKNSADRGMQRADDETLGSIKHPVVSIQIGSPSDSYESRLLDSPPFQDSVAKGIGDGIMKYHFVTRATAPEE